MSVDSYLIRIYRRTPGKASARRTHDKVDLVGIVETAAGNEQRRFHTIEELWDFLAGEADAEEINSSEP